MEEIFVGLLAAAIPLIVLIALAGFVAVGGVVFAEAKVCMGQICRELRRRPQFGIVSLFSLTAVFALASALLGQIELQPGFPTLFVAFLALVWAFGAVCAVQFLAGDVVALFWSRGSREVTAPADPWECPDPAVQLQSTPDFSWLSREDPIAPAAFAGIEPPAINVRD